MTKHDSPYDSTTVTHFTEPVVQDENHRPVPDRSNLSALYPHPKTFDERQKDQEQRDRLREERLPKHPHVKIALFGSALLSVALLFAQNVINMWMTGGIAGIFFSFALWLILFGGVIMWIKYTNNIFYVYGKSASLFWIGCSGMLTLFAVMWATNWPISFMASHLMPFFSLGYLIGLIIVGNVTIRS